MAVREAAAPERTTALKPAEGVASEGILDPELEDALVAGLAEPEESEPKPEPSPSEESPATGAPLLDAEADATVVPPPLSTAPAVGGDLESLEVASDGRVAALAFATDLDTENALREGLFDYRVPDHDEPRVWSGGLHAAIAALAHGEATPLVLVDVDGVPYPAGALHELAAFCDVGTVVIALGSDGTASTIREILLAGVSDYLVKPVTAAAVRETVARVALSAGEVSRGGCVAGFVGVGGSGTTTLAAAATLHASEQGRYVSVLDLKRTVSTVALMLDVEPAPGLEQLLETADGPSPDPNLVDDVRVERSDRVAVYAYRTGLLTPPAPRKAAVNWLLSELRQRSQFVFVDGLDDPALYLDLLADVDTRVLVLEPTVRDTDRAARIVDLLGETPPVVLVRNHTRRLRRAAAARALRAASLETAFDVVFPFEAALPAITDRGWPEGRLPRSLTKPLTTLTDRILAASPAGEPAVAGLRGS